MTKPLVSICMISYNHEKFITQAIESVLMQKTNFNYELIISDDFSTDNTANIIEGYEIKYPEKIKAQLSKINVGIGENFVKTLKACQGKYIALLEGDDFWTDPLKLQKQINFLESNKEFSICFHKVRILENGKLKKDKTTNAPGSVTGIYELGKQNYIHTPTCVFRKNSDVLTKLDSYKDLKVGDYSLHLYNAKHGKIKYLNEPMAVYRKHEGSNWSNKDSKYIVENFNNLLERLINSGDFKKMEHLLKYQLLENLWSYFMKNINNDTALAYLHKIVKEDTDFLLDKIKKLHDSNNRRLSEKIAKKIYVQLFKKRIETHK